MRNFFGTMDNNHNNNNDNALLTAQNVRRDIVGELDAIVQYLDHYYATTDSKARQTIMDIVGEEQVHVGQLFGLLFSLDPTSKTNFEKGYNEFLK